MVRAWALPVAALTAACGQRIGPPALTSVDPTVVCSDGVASLTLHGRGMTPAPVDSLSGTPALEVPQVRLHGSGSVRDADNVLWISDEAVTAQVAFDGLPVATYDVMVINPDGQQATLPHALERRAGGELSIDQLVPSLVCTGTDQTVTILGMGFAPDVEVTVLDAGGRAVLTPKVTASVTQLEVTMPGGSLLPGVYRLVVRNPSGDACQGTAQAGFRVVPTQPGGLAKLAPEVLCDAASDQVVTVSGTGFPRDAEVAMVDASGVVVLRPKVTAAGGQLRVALPENSLPPGAYTLAVLPPGGATCAPTASGVLTILPPPAISALMPPEVCLNGGTIAVTGSGFEAGATVTLTDPASLMSIDATTVTVTSSIAAVTRFGNNRLPRNAMLDLMWRNPDGCNVMLPQAVALLANRNCP